MCLSFSRRILFALTLVVAGTWQLQAAEPGSLGESSHGYSHISLIKTREPLRELKHTFDLGTRDSLGSDLSVSGHIAILGCEDACRMLLDTGVDNQVLTGQHIGDKVPYRLKLEGTLLSVSVDAGAYNRVANDHYTGIVEVLIESE